MKILHLNKKCPILIGGLDKTGSININLITPKYLRFQK